MKNILVMILLGFLVFGIALSFPIVLADEDDDNSSSGSDSDSSGSGSSGDNKEDKDDDNDKSETKTITTIIDENGNEVTVETETKTNGDGETETKETRTYIDENGNEVTVEIKIETEEDGETETKETRTYIDENGNEVKIVIKTETKDGESKTEEKRTITSPDGTKITFKTKTEVEDGETTTKTSVKIEGVEFTTKLSIKESFEDGEVKLTVKLSTGADQDIIVQPDEALLLAIEELKAGNISIELSERGEGEKIKAVFKATTTQEGKFLGIFNTQIDLETLIDTETGDIIETTRPWWAFLVVGADEETMCHIPDGDETKRTIISIALTEVKMHLEHGDSVGVCIAECGDGIIVEGDEQCEIGNTQSCTDTNGYAGTQICNIACNGFNECLSTEFCGDGIINGDETCDDNNNVNGDGCSSICEIEIVQTNSTINTTN